MMLGSRLLLPQARRCLASTGITLFLFLMFGLQTHRQAQYASMLSALLVQLEANSPF